MEVNILTGVAESETIKKRIRDELSSSSDSRQISLLKLNYLLLTYIPTINEKAINALKSVDIQLEDSYTDLIKIMLTLDKFFPGITDKEKIKLVLLLVDSVCITALRKYNGMSREVMALERYCDGRRVRLYLAILLSTMNVKEDELSEDAKKYLAERNMELGEIYKLIERMDN